MSEIFIKLLNMSISAGWLVLCVVALRLILKKAPRWIACILWALVAVRLLCPFSLESVLSLVPSAETVPEEIIYSEIPEIESGIPIINSTVNPIISDSLAPAPKAEVNPMEIITGTASVIWIIGVAAMAIYAVVSYIRIRKRVSEAIEEEKGVWICDRIDTPFILGLFSPRIILPSSLSGEDREYVVSHEKAHLSRMDHLWKPLGYALLTVYWFNPLIWIGYILLCRDIEAACDEKVIKQLGEGAKKPYAEALINCSVPKKMISACPLAFGETGVKGRVRNVLNYKKPAFWIIIVAIVACVVVAVCFLTNPKDKPEKAPDKDGNAVVDTTDDETTDDETKEETIEDKYKKAKAALTILDETKKDEISAAYDEYFKFSWYDIDSKYARTGDGMRCYGVFENCIVLFESTDATVVETKKVAYSEFTHTSSFALYAYYDNCLYSLKEAYDKGLISSDEVETAAERHRIVEEYIKSLRTVDDTIANETTKLPEETTGVPEETTRVPEETMGKPIETNPPSGTEDTTGKQNSKPKDTTDKIVTTSPPTTTKEETNKSLPEPPAKGLLAQIAKDFFDYHVEKYNFDPKINGGFYVSDYYGTYNNAVPVIMVGTGMSYADVITTETVAGYTFTYSNSNKMKVWNNGSFYSLQEAYDKGLLTKEDIGKIAATKPIEYSPGTENAYFEDELSYKYYAALNAITVLDASTKDKLANAMGVRWKWLDYNNLLPEKISPSIACCYGVFDGCVVIFSPNQLDVNTTIKVANSTFYYSSGFNMFVLYNDTLYTLKEAYDNGFISAENVEKAAVNHQIVQDYCNYCIKLKYS